MNSPTHDLEEMISKILSDISKKNEYLNDLLIGNIDADVWAKAFCELHAEDSLDLMRTWFASAIMAGYDAGVRSGCAGPLEVPK